MAMLIRAAQWKRIHSTADRWPLFASAFSRALERRRNNPGGSAQAHMLAAEHSVSGMCVARARRRLNQKATSIAAGLRRRLNKKTSSSAALPSAVSKGGGKKPELPVDVSPDAGLGVPGNVPDLGLDFAGGKLPNEVVEDGSDLVLADAGGSADRRCHVSQGARCPGEIWATCDICLVPLCGEHFNASPCHDRNSYADCKCLVCRMFDGP